MEKSGNDFCDSTPGASPPGQENNKNSDCAKDLRRVLSWDCGFKNLAWTIARIDIHQVGDDHFSIAKSFDIEQIAVVDILGKDTKKVCELDKIQALCDFLQSPRAPQGHFDFVLIEHQPIRVGAHSTASSQIGFNLALYYKLAGCDVRFVSPKYKKNIAFSSELTVAKISETVAKPYAALKKHSRENIRFFLTQTGRGEMLKTLKAKLDDVGDSLLQILGFFIFDVKTIRVRNHN